MQIVLTKKITERYTLTEEELFAIRNTISILGELKENTEILDNELLKEVSTEVADIIQGLEEVLRLNDEEYSTEIENHESST